MRKFTTILCSITFAISGILMAIMSNNNTVTTGYKTINAMPSVAYTFPTFQTDTATLDISEDLLRDLAKRKGVLDTVYITKTDTIKEQVTKVKVKKVPVPSNVMEINVSPTRTDTIQVPVYYLATQVDNKEDTTGECIPIYEVRKVDEICPEIINSSAKSVTE